MTEQLKPCPFCGGINIIHSGFRMYCHTCGAEGPDADSADESAAIAAWNRRAQPAQAGAEPVAWQGGEGWESLAWELCADENGEESCDELVWEGGPIPEPWGDRWMKYEGEAKRLIALVHKHTAPLYTHPPARVPLTDVEIAVIASKPCTVVGSYVHTFARDIIAAYEAKNGIGGGK